MTSEDKQTEVKVIQQGTVKITSVGYMLETGENCAIFFFDVGDRAYPVASSAYDVGSPSLWLEDNEDEDHWTYVCFPDFIGWSVHCVSGGKVISVALRKDK